MLQCQINIKTSAVRSWTYIAQEKNKSDKVTNIALELAQNIKGT